MHLGFVLTLLFFVFNNDGVSAQFSNDWAYFRKVLETVRNETIKLRKEFREEDIELRKELKEIKKEFNNTITQVTKECMEEDIELRKELKEIKKEFNNTITQVTKMNQMELQEVKLELNETTKWKMENEKIIAELLKLLQINCDDHFKIGRKVNSGVEKIYPFSPALNFVQAYCEYIVEGEYQGGWTVIQRRDDNVAKRENFKRRWDDYTRGFGSPEGEYWIGLNVIHALTNIQPMQLQIILEDWHNKTETVNYKHFRIDDESKNYKIHISGFKGNIEDRMAVRNEMDFSTTDRDNDKHRSFDCANALGGGGGWWYNACRQDNLNGLPHPKEKKEDGGIIWIGFNPSVNYHPLRRTTMMIKPLH